MGINFIDTIVVRRSLNKRTSTTDDPTTTAEFMGAQNKLNTEERVNLAGDLWIMSDKETSKIKLSEVKEPKSVAFKGYCISTGKGTGLQNRIEKWLGEKGITFSLIFEPITCFILR